jgi:type II secretory pathway component PulJ
MMRRGHSLNELMVAVSLSMILMSLIFGISVNMQTGTERINRKVDQNTGAQSAIDLLRADVELAGHRSGGGVISRAGRFPAGDFCGISSQAVPDQPDVGVIPGHQLLVLRSDRFPGRVEGFQMGQRNQVPDGRIAGMDEEVVYAFQRYDDRRNLWRLRRAYRTGENADWACMTLLENLVVAGDGSPFRYDVLVNRRGERVIDRNLSLQNPVLPNSARPFGGNVPNELFEIDGRGGINLLDFDALVSGSLLAGVHMRFCIGDGRDLPGRLPYECNPEDMRRSSNNLRLIEVGLTTKNLLTWRAYIEGRQG